MGVGGGSEEEEERPYSPLNSSTNSSLNEIPFSTEYLYYM
jgi:hypothetical protein